MHPMEYKKEKVGTGRFSHLILKNSEIIVDVGFDENKRLKEILFDEEYETYLLYPGDEAFNLSTAMEWKTLKQRKPQFIILDGTWPCAKKMMKLSTCLHHLPRVSFSSSITSDFIIKHQPLAGCLSTVESIYQLIKELNKLNIEQTDSHEINLIDVFKHTVSQQLELASDPTREGYRKRAFSSPTKRKQSKKWEHRLLFFKE